MKYVWLPILAVVVLTALLCILSGPGVMIALLLGWLAVIGVLAGWLTCWKGRREPGIQEESNVRITRGRLWLTGLATALVILGWLSLTLRTLSATREFAKSAVSMSNLRTVKMGLSIYVNDQGDYPPTLAELVANGQITWSSLLAVSDPDWPAGVPEDVAKYSSYIYQPGAGEWLNDPDLTLAYEHGKWTPTAMRIFPRYGRFVLFADGRVEALTEDEFTAARLTDQARRAELNWPPPTTE